MSGDVWQHDLKGERDRLRLMSDLLDPSSRVHLLRTGVATGWRCLEIGAGNGSLSQWLAQRVGPTGHVVVRDICTDLLEGIVAMAGTRRGCISRWSSNNRGQDHRQYGYRVQRSDRDGRSPVSIDDSQPHGIWA